MRSSDISRLFVKHFVLGGQRPPNNGYARSSVRQLRGRLRRAPGAVEAPTQIDQPLEGRAWRAHTRDPGDPQIRPLSQRRREDPLQTGAPGC